MQKEAENWSMAVGWGGPGQAVAGGRCQGDGESSFRCLSLPPSLLSGDWSSAGVSDKSPSYEGGKIQL